MLYSSEFQVCRTMTKNACQASSVPVLKVDRSRVSVD